MNASLKSNTSGRKSESRRWEMPTFNTVGKEKLHNVLMKFKKKKRRVKRR